MESKIYLNLSQVTGFVGARNSCLKRNSPHSPRVGSGWGGWRIARGGRREGGKKEEREGEERKGGGQGKDYVSQKYM